MIQSVNPKNNILNGGVCLPSKADCINSAVGDVLFGGDMRTCKIPECKRKHLAKGYCRKHYKQMRRYGKILKRTILIPNEFIVKEDYCFIFLYNNKGIKVAKTIINIEDIEKCKQYKWHLNSKGYVETWIRTGNRGHHLCLHNLVMEHKGIDHINCNKLDNRKENLRYATQSENGMNRIVNRNSSSKFKGVSWNTGVKKWKVQITKNGKRRYLGCFDNEKEAASVYNIYAKKLFGEFARLNEV